MSETPEGPGKPPEPPKKPAPAAPKMTPVEEALRREVASPALEALKDELGGEMGEVVHYAGEVTVVVPRERIIEVLTFLRDDERTAFNLLADLTAADWPERGKRFDIVYHLYSIPRNHRLRVKVHAGEGEPVASAASIWKSADWHEREVYDLFGVAFEGHPDLRRILLPDEWEGHPLRKEYPLEGFPHQHMRLR